MIVVQFDMSTPDVCLIDSIVRNYPRILKLKAEKLKDEKAKLLLQLDKWYHNVLATTIQSRGDKHITHAELCELMKWKLTRGKFRPRLTELVKTNSEESVIDASKRAFAKLPDLAAAIRCLSELKAVGPATASAILAAGAPDHAAFMSDEAMQCFPDLKPIQYTLPFYLQYMQHVKKMLSTLKKQDHKWTPYKLELALWTWRTSRILGTDISEGKIVPILEKSDDCEMKEGKKSRKRKRQSKS